MSKLDSDPRTVHLKMVHYRSESWKVTKYGTLNTSVKIPVCLWTLELVPFHWTTFSLISSVEDESDDTDDVSDDADDENDDGDDYIDDGGF